MSSDCPAPEEQVGAPDLEPPGVDRQVPGRGRRHLLPRPHRAVSHPEGSEVQVVELEVQVEVEVQVVVQMQVQHLWSVQRVQVATPRIEEERTSE